jgi:hypothetical protein
MVWVSAFLALCLTFAATNALYAQAKFPAALMGGWCSVSDEGERVDITNSSLEEGDGECQIKKLRRDSTNYELTMSCSPGVEGKKDRLVTERFRVMQMEGKQYLLRAGGMYNPKNLALYKQC